MLRSLLFALCAVCLFSSSSRADEWPSWYYELPEGSIVIYTSLFAEESWVCVDGEYEGSPGLGGGLIKAKLWVTAYVPDEGIQDFYFDVSEDATYTTDNQIAYPVDGVTVTESGLVVSVIYVSVEEGVGNITITYGDLTASATIVVKGPAESTWPYTEKAYKAKKREAAGGNP